MTESTRFRSLKRRVPALCRCMEEGTWLCSGRRLDCNAHLQGQQTTCWELPFTAHENAMINARPGAVRHAALAIRTQPCERYQGSCLQYVYVILSSGICLFVTSEYSVFSNATFGIRGMGPFALTCVRSTPGHQNIRD